MSVLLWIIIIYYKMKLIVFFFFFSFSWFQIISLFFSIVEENLNARYWRVCCLPFRNEEGKHSYSSGMEARLSPDKSLTFASVPANDRGKSHLRPRLRRINITRECTNILCFMDTTERYSYQKHPKIDPSSVMSNQIYNLILYI